MKNEFKKHIASLGVLIVFGLLATGSIDTDTPSGSNSTPTRPESSSNKESKSNKSIEDKKTKEAKAILAKRREEIEKIQAQAMEKEMAIEALKTEDAKRIKNAISDEEKRKRQEARTIELNEIIKNASESDDITKRDAYKELYEINNDLTFYKIKFEQYSRKVDEKNKNNEKPIITEKTTNNSLETPKSNYFVIEQKKINDMPNQTSIGIEAVVSGSITELVLSEILDKLYKEAKEYRGFKFNQGAPTHFLILLYNADKSNHQLKGGDMYIARLKKQGVKSEVEIEISKDKIAQLSLAPEDKFGFSEEKRKEISIEIVQCEDRAFAEAWQMYPLSKDGNDPNNEAQLQKQQEFYNKMKIKYKTEIWKKYNITKEQSDAITSEAMKKNWPSPSIK